ncbi:hypothetical protein [Halalkalibacter lacteus]|uniref:hypothetical protein n=1 Tax=Halalkalibacter lacteus TaxID=3090663 RepID=UPI002FCC1051
MNGSNNAYLEEIDDLKEQLTELNALNEELNAELELIYGSTKAGSYYEEDNFEEEALNEEFFSLGSTQEHVKLVMGSPDSIVAGSWWYGKQSWIKFDQSGLVTSYHDGEGILKIQ